MAAINTYDNIGECYDCLSTGLLVKVNACVDGGVTKWVCMDGCLIKCNWCKQILDTGKLNYRWKPIRTGAYLPRVRCCSCKTVNVPSQCWIGPPPAWWKNKVCGAETYTRQRAAAYIGYSKDYYYGICDDCDRRAIVMTVPADARGHPHLSPRVWKWLCVTGCKVLCSHGCGEIIDYATCMHTEGWRPDVVCPRCKNYHATMQQYGKDSPFQRCARAVRCDSDCFDTDDYNHTPKVVKLYFPDIMNWTQFTISLRFHVDELLMIDAARTRRGINRRTMRGITTLEMAWNCRMSFTVMQFLVNECGADVHQRTSNGDSIVDHIYRTMCCWTEHRLIIEMMIRSGCGSVIQDCMQFPHGLLIMILSYLDHV